MKKSPFFIVLILIVFGIIGFGLYKESLLEESRQKKEHARIERLDSVNVRTHNMDSILKHVVSVRDIVGNEVNATNFRNDRTEGAIALAAAWECLNSGILELRIARFQARESYMLSDGTYDSRVKEFFQRRDNFNNALPVFLKALEMYKKVNGLGAENMELPHKARTREQTVHTGTFDPNKDMRKQDQLQ